MPEITRHAGPQIWIQGDPAEVEEILPLGISGIITNTIILDDLTHKYGQLRGLLERYLELTDKTVVVEVDADTVDDYLYAADVARRLAPEQIAIKVPSKKIGLQAIARLKAEGTRTMATTVFSLNQAVMMAAAGASWVAPFVGPTDSYGSDALKLCREIAAAFAGRPNAPVILGGIVRTPDLAYQCFAGGCDAIVIYPECYWKMLEHPGTAEWNHTFRTRWQRIVDDGLAEGFIRSQAAAALRR